MSLVHSIPRRRTILLVDDDAHVRQTLALFLRWSGEWEPVGEASDCAAALALAAAHHPDLVLIDVWLPDCNALTLIVPLRALVPPPLIVFLTSDASPDLREQALALGANAFILKFTQPLDLLHELRTLTRNLTEGTEGIQGA